MTDERTALLKALAAQQKMMRAAIEAGKEARRLKAEREEEALRRASVSE